MYSDSGGSSPFFSGSIKAYPDSFPFRSSFILVCQIRSNTLCYGYIPRPVLTPSYTMPSLPFGFLNPWYIS